MSRPLAVTNLNRRFDSEQYVEGYATTFNDPYVLYEYDGIKIYEQIDRNALIGADLSDVIMQYDHAGKVLARNTNGSLGVEVDTKGLFMFADLSKSTEARNLFEEITNQLITKMSWAFNIKEESYDNDTHTRTILRVGKVYDVSAVSYPANADTEISARNFFNGVIEEQSRSERAQKLSLLKIKLNLEV